MKNKANHEFRQLRVKIFLRTIAMLVISASIVYITYSVLLRGNFANLMMALLQNNNTVMAHIGRLREKMGEPARSPKFIKTVWGVGYTIEK